MAGGTAEGGVRAVRDASGFDDFYRNTRHRTLQYLYAAGGNLAEAQDAAQEAYARAWQNWAEVGRYGSPEAWVRTVGWRIQVNGWRAVRNRVRAYRRHGVPGPAGPPGEDTVVLVAALRGLPTEQRIAIALYHLLGLSLRDVAAETGVPLGTVKARLSRGRRALAAALGSPLRGDGDRRADGLAGVVADDRGAQRA